MYISNKTTNDILYKKLYTKAIDLWIGHKFLEGTLLTKSFKIKN